jgi:hypothetical protein
MRRLLHLQARNTKPAEWMVTPQLETGDANQTGCGNIVH